MKPVLVRPAAAADIEDAYSWHETQRPGLDDEFRDALRHALNLVGANPKIHQVIHRDTRRALLKRFPYGVYYREFSEVIVVVACMHGRRDPKRWQARGKEGR